MRNRGKGFPLAFFLFSIFRAAFCIAEESVPGTETHSVETFPVIERLDWRDEKFRQFIADVETNRQRVFNRGINHEEPNDFAGSLAVYQYVPKDDEGILSLAARCSLPYETLASLNRLNHSSAFDLDLDRPLLLPTAPGIFVPKDPRSDLEYLLASGRFPPQRDEAVELIIGESMENTGNVFYFFPGGEFSPTERAFFLNSGFHFPLRSYRLTSSYGMRRNPVTGNMRLHQGLDLAAPAGTEVHAAGNGIVTEAGSDPIYGNYIIIKHNGNWASLYGHLQKIIITLQARVQSGTIIGLVGSTGQSTGPHLHFELRQNGKAQDPDKYLFLPGGR